MSQFLEKKSCAQRYAKALRYALEENSSLQEGYDAVQALLPSLSTQEIRSYLTQPTLSHDAKSKTLKDIIKTMKAPEPFLGLVTLLCARRRLWLLPDIFISASNILAHACGYVDIYLKTSHPLDSSRLEELEDIFKKKISLQAHTHHTVDEDLLCGFSLQIGNTIMENALSIQLKSARSVLGRSLD